jgi:hypothetical protein
VLGGLLAGAAWVSAVTGFFYPQLLPGERASLAPDPPESREPSDGSHQY